MQRIVRQISCSLRSMECLWFTYAVRVSFWRHRVPLGKVERAGSLPRIIEGIKRKYGASDSNKVGDGPEPLHDYLDVSSVREWRAVPSYWIFAEIRYLGIDSLDLASISTYIIIDCGIKFMSALFP